MGGLGGHGSDGDDDARGSQQVVARGPRRERVQSNRTAHLVISRHWWLAGFIAGQLALAEWIRRPSSIAAIVAIIGLGLAIAGSLSRTRPSWVFAAVLALQAVVMGTATIRLRD